LKARYEAKGVMKKMSLLESLTKMRALDFTKSSDAIDRFQSLRLDLLSLDATIDDLFMTVFVNLFKKEHPAWSDRILSTLRTGKDEFTIDRVIEDIADCARDPEVDASILYARHDTRRYPRTGAGIGNHNNRQRGGGSSKKCSHCSKQGHLEADCWLLHPEKNPRKLMHRRSHQNLQSRQPDRPRISYSDTMIQVLRFHPAAEAPGDRTPMMHLKNDDLHVRAASIHLVSKTLSDAWLYDTGASRHVCNNERLFQTYMKLQDGPHVTTASGSTQIEGIGTIQLKVKLSTRETSILTLNNVLHIPSAPLNLYSGYQASKKDAWLHGPSMTMRAYPDDVELFQLKHENDGFFINVAVHDIRDDRLMNVAFASNAVAPNAVAPEEEMLEATTSGTKLQLWHRRTGHLGYQNLHKMKDKVIGIEIKPSPSTPPCHVCPESKAVRTQSKTPQARAMKPYEKLHVDVIGPIKPIGFNGDRYATVLTDDFDRTRTVKPHKHKSDVSGILKQFVIDADTQTGTPNTTKTVRIDNGTEYTKLLDWLRARGIKVEPTVAYTPEQDGVAERSNRIILERTRSFILDSGCPAFLWPGLITGVAHTLNRTPTRSLDGMTPYEALTGNKPDISHLRILGCKAYVHIPKEKRAKSFKFDSRAAPGILVGYDGTKIYKIWIPGPTDESSGKIVRASAVTFDESPGSGASVARNTSDEPFIIPVVEHLIPETLELSTEADSPVQDTITITPRNLEPSHSSIEETPFSSAGEQSNEEPSCEDSSEALRQPSPRRSSRAIRRPDRFMIASTRETDLPKTIHEAMASPSVPEWKKAIDEEITSLLANNTWTEYDELPCNLKPLKGRWVFTHKLDQNNRIIKFKARWVIKGYEQVEGIDYDETFASVAKGPTLRILMALAASENLIIHQMDVSTAFLNGDIDTEIWIELPETSGRQNRYGKLNKSLYGLKQSPRLWQQKLSEELLRLGYRQLRNDNCVYLKDDIIILVYVDDFLILGPRIEKIKSEKQALQRTFKMRDLGPCSQFLGIDIHQDRTNHQVHLSQASYIDKLATRFNVKPSKASTPLEITRVKELHTPHHDDDESKELRISPDYQSKVGSLMYGMCHTRPDLAFALSILSRFLSSPSPKHQEALERVLSYTVATKTHGLSFAEEPELEIIAYCDADYANDTATRRSTSGYAIFLGSSSSPVVWKSQRQRSVALSTAEAEYYAITEVIKETLWIKSLLRELEKEAKIIVYTDNQAALAIAKNPEHHQRSKHIDIRCHFIRDHIQSGEIDLQYIPTGNQIADGFTKQLPAASFTNFVANLHLESRPLTN
jgi:hypothetical protein